MQEPSIEEKIDFIYKRLKKEEQIEKRELFMKWGGRALFGMFLGYMYFFGVNLIIQKTTESVQMMMSENAGAVKDSVSDLYNSVRNKVTGTTKTSLETEKMSEEEMKRYTEF